MLGYGDLDARLYVPLCYRAMAGYDILRHIVTLGLRRPVHTALQKNYGEVTEIELRNSKKKQES